MTEQHKRWMDWFDDDELGFIKRFVLLSGSLKALAEVYGVTYPTIRLRMDRVIQKLQIIEDQRIDTDFERLVQTKFADGKIDAETCKAILAAYCKEKETQK